MLKKGKLVFLSLFGRVFVSVLTVLTFFSSVSVNALPPNYSHDLILYDSDFYDLPRQVFSSSNTRAQNIAVIQTFLEDANTLYAETSGRMSYAGKTGILATYRVNVSFYSDSGLEDEWNQKKDSISSLPSYCNRIVDLEAYKTLEGFKKCEKDSWDDFITANDLEGYIGMNLSVAEFIWMLSQENLGRNGTWSSGVNPLYILSLIQKEQGLVYGSRSLSSENPNINNSLKFATGYYCFTGRPCDLAYSGFFKQVFHAIKNLKKLTYTCNMVPIVVTDSYSKNPITITPKSKATCANYKYTPHYVYETFYNIMTWIDFVMSGVSEPPKITINKTESLTDLPQLTGTVDDQEATIKITVNGKTYTAVNNGSTWSITVTTSLPNGTYEVIAEATDKNGNVGMDTTSNELVVNKPAHKKEPKPVEYTQPIVRSEDDGADEREEMIKEARQIIAIKVEKEKEKQKEEDSIVKKESKSFSFLRTKDNSNGDVDKEGEVLGVFEDVNHKNSTSFTIYNALGVGFILTSVLLISFALNRKFVSANGVVALAQVFDPNRKVTVTPKTKSKLSSKNSKKSKKASSKQAKKKD